MKRFVGFIIFALLLSVRTVHAQFPRFGGAVAMQMFNPFSSGFNPETIIKVTGKIKKLTNVKNRMIPTICAIINTETGDEYEVRLGPMMFIRNLQNFSFRRGTEMEVVGSQIEKQDQREVIIAMKVTVDGNETVLRDEMGIPAWAPISRKSGGGMMGMMGNMMGGGGMMGRGMMGRGMMGGGMMGGGGMMNKGHSGGRDTETHPPAQKFPGEPGQEIHMFGHEDTAEEAEDIQGGKIPGGYK